MAASQEEFLGSEATKARKRRYCQGKVTLPGSYSRRGLRDTRTSPCRYVTNTLKKGCIGGKIQESPLFSPCGARQRRRITPVRLGKLRSPENGGKSRALLLGVIAGYRGTDRFNKNARIFVWIRKNIRFFLREVGWIHLRLYRLWEEELV